MDDRGFLDGGLFSDGGSIGNGGSREREAELDDGTLMGLRMRVVLRFRPSITLAVAVRAESLGMSESHCFRRWSLGFP